MAWEPMLGHIEDEISKNKGKKIHWASTKIETHISTPQILLIL
jgi:hypothetical protein